MLKIKDNVDLKELEKFGYVELNKVYCKIIPIYKNNGSAKVIRISKTNKLIYSREYCKDDLKDFTLKKFIADLIKADLVEKVEDK